MCYGIARSTERHSTTYVHRRRRVYIAAMALRDTTTCPSDQASSPANKRGNHHSESSTATPSNGEGTLTPTRKNKRKMSEPRRRTDVPMKRISLEDGVTDDLDMDDDDDDLTGVRQLPGVSSSSSTFEQSPSSDERNNSTGSGPSPVPAVTPMLLPPIPPHFLAGSVAGMMYPTPVITNVGGIPRYALVPGLPPGFPTGFPAGFPAGFLPGHGLVHPGMGVPGGTPTITSTPTASNTQYKSPDMDKNHNCVLTRTNNNNNNNNNGPSPSGSQCSAPSPSPSNCSVLDSHSSRASRKQRKNYKNMTRERRVEANARERTRVHTISAAFESLRRAVPSYSYHQRLSKLAILRIACSYILALSRLTDNPDCVDEEENDELSFGDCVDLCTQTIQSEGRAKRRH